MVVSKNDVNQIIKIEVLVVTDILYISAINHEEKDINWNYIVIVLLLVIIYIEDLDRKNLGVGCKNVWV